MRKILFFTICVSIIICFGTILVRDNNSTGTLVVKIRDQLGDWNSASAIYISVSEVSIHRADAGNESGWIKTGIGVTNLSIGETGIFYKVIGETSLGTGLYNVIRVNLIQAIVTVNGKNYSCNIENGILNIPIILGGVRIQALKIAYLEIDVTPTIIHYKDEYWLVPAARAQPT